MRVSGLSATESYTKRARTVGLDGKETPGGSLASGTEVRSKNLLAWIIAGSISMISIRFNDLKVASALADMPLPRPMVSALSAFGCSSMAM